MSDKPSLDNLLDKIRNKPTNNSHEHLLDVQAVYANRAYISIPENMMPLVRVTFTEVAQGSQERPISSIMVSFNTLLQMQGAIGKLIEQVNKLQQQMMDDKNSQTKQ